MTNMTTRHPGNRLITMAIIAFISTTACKTPEEKCQIAHEEAAEAWTGYATMLRNRPALPQQRVNAQMGREWDRYDAECRRMYGIGSPDPDRIGGPEPDMSDEQAYGLIACRTTLPRVDLRDWPATESAEQMAQSASAEALEVFRARLEAFKRLEGRMTSYGPDHRRAYEASDELIEVCGALQRQGGAQ